MGRWGWGRPTVGGVVGSGAEVWIEDAEECYTLARVIEVNSDGTLLVEKAAGDAEKKIVSPANNGEKNVFYPYLADDSTSEDLVQMLHVDQPNMMNTLRTRHLATWQESLASTGAPCGCVC